MTTAKSYNVYDVNRVSNALWLQGQQHPDAGFQCSACLRSIDWLDNMNRVNRVDFAKHVIFDHGVVVRVYRVDRVSIPLGLQE